MRAAAAADVISGGGLAGWAVFDFRTSRDSSTRRGDDDDWGDDHEFFFRETAAKTEKKFKKQKFDFLGKHTILLLSLKQHWLCSGWYTAQNPSTTATTPSVVYYDVFDGNI